MIIVTNMDDDVLNTIFYAFEVGDLSWPNGNILFLNGQIDQRFPDSIEIQQFFKPLADKAFSHIPENKSYDLIILHAPRQQIEMRYYIGHALNLMNKTGHIICVASNDAGGRRLKDEIKKCGIEPSVISKNKCQLVYFKPDGLTAPNWINQGQAQEVLSGSFISQPGIYGWNKVDTGSELLINTLTSHNFGGVGADFGCGYGYLSDGILKLKNDIQKIYYIDADSRALECAKANFNATCKADYLWLDLRHEIKNIEPLDWIVMNPPFHQKKETNYKIGEQFITTASKALKKSGSLWMVANVHLPYERVFKDKFSDVEKIKEAKGFKVFHAVK